MITNKTINITSEDVTNCSNLNLLYEWEAAVQADIYRINVTARALKAKLDAGHSIDYDAYVRRETAKSFQIALITEIKGRISLLEREQKGALNTEIVNILRDTYIIPTYGMEEWEAIIKRAKQRVNEIF